MGDGSFLLQDLHFNGCDGLVTFLAGFEASTPPLCRPTHGYCPLRGFDSVMLGLPSVAVKLFFHFFGDLLSTPHFPLLCCRPESNTECPNPASTTIWTKDLLSKRKGIYFFERVLFIPYEASRECSTCFLFFHPKKNKKNLFVNSNLNLISTSSAIVF